MASKVVEVSARPAARHAPKQPPDDREALRALEQARSNTVSQRKLRNSTFCRCSLVSKSRTSHGSGSVCANFVEPNLVVSQVAVLCSIRLTICGGVRRSALVEIASPRQPCPDAVISLVHASSFARRQATGVIWE
jgi:hypothetical protein